VKEHESGGERLSIRALIEIDQWQKIQNLLAEIIGADLNLFDYESGDLVISSEVTPSCRNLASPLYPWNAPAQSDCLRKAFQQKFQRN